MWIAAGVGGVGSRCMGRGQIGVGRAPRRLDWDWGTWVDGGSGRSRISVDDWPGEEAWICGMGVIFSAWIG